MNQPPTERARRSGVCFLPPAPVFRLALCLLSLGVGELAAHTPVTTKFRFSEDILPILERHCTRCHRPGGGTPFSLREYASARPWAESIKEQVLERNMPPLYVDGGVALKNGSRLSAREIDTIVSWASGGAPERAKAEGGRAEGEPPPIERTWSRFVSSASFRLADGEASVTVEASFPAGEQSFLHAWKLADGAGAPLRRGRLFVENGSTSQLVGTWTRGEDEFSFAADAAIALPPGATLRIAATYVRTWREQKGEIALRPELLVAAPAKPPTAPLRSFAWPPGSFPRLPESAQIVAFEPPRAGSWVRGDDGHAPAELVVFRADPSHRVTYRLAHPLARAGLRWVPAGDDSQDPGSEAGVVWISADE